MSTGHRTRRSFIKSSIGAGAGIATLGTSVMSALPANASVASQSATTFNLVPNPGFEDTFDGQPAHWPIRCARSDSSDMIKSDHGRWCMMHNAARY